MKPIALILMVTLPSMGWAQLAPMFPQSDAPLARTLVPTNSASTLEAAPPAAPIYKRWYFWTGVAVTLAGVLAASIAVGMSRPRQEPLSSAQVCGPTGCDACVGITCR